MKVYILRAVSSLQSRNTWSNQNLIEIHRGIKNWSVSGKIVNRVQIFGPFDTDKKFFIKIFMLSTSSPTNVSKYRFGLYARQMLLPLGICGNIDLL